MADIKSRCIYGNSCCLVNPEHFRQFNHPNKILKKKGFSLPPDGGYDEDLGSINLRIKKTTKTNLPAPRKMQTPIDQLIADCHGFFLNKSQESNLDGSMYSVDLKDILDDANGKLIQSFHFNFIFDFEWLIEQYPPKIRQLPMHIIYGFKGHFDDIKIQAAQYKQCKLHPIKIKDLFGSHHTKMILLQYEDGLRIIIHTANMIQKDWDYRTQGLWISPKLKMLKPSEKDTCPTDFKEDFIKYLNHYDCDFLKQTCQSLIRKCNFSPVNVYLIGSTPGRHENSERSSFGHLRLRKILKSPFGPTQRTQGWPVLCQFSSIGSLGPDPKKWLVGQFLCSLSTISDDDNLEKPALQCIYPCVEDIRLSLEGYKSGTSFPYMKRVASKQKYLNDYLHKWRALKSERTELAPHIKSYCRVSPDHREMSWFLLTSANLSKAAWGELQKNGSQLFIRSFELGVLFLPKIMINQDSFKLKPIIDHSGDRSVFNLPYDLPLIPYGREDKPWICDISYVDKPDSRGTFQIIQ